MNHLVPVELNNESFKDYGHVISEKKIKPNAHNDEFKYWSKTSEFKINTAVSTGILCPSKREMVVKCFERHINTIEVMVALEGDSIICVGKQSACEEEEIERVQAFYIKQGEGFVMNEGIWHWAPYPVNSMESKFLIMFKLGTEDNDLEVKHLSNEIKVNINI